jgi:hypothetical protein
MATIDLGRLGFVNKGTYNNSTTYEKNDLVQFTDGGILSTYLYIDSTAQSGQAPSSSGTAGSRWVFFAKGVADAVASAGNNKVLVTNASGNLTPLAIGSAGHFLRTNAGANGFEFVEADAGKTLGVHQFTNSTRQSGVTQTGSRTVLWQVGTFTKQKANSKLKIDLVLPGGSNASTYPHFATDFIRFSTTNYDTNGSDIFGYIHNTRVDNLTFGANLIGHFLYDTTSTNISGTGTIYITLGYHSAGSSIHPFSVWNPNSSEDTRSRQTTSYVVITELDV